ncbi:MAG: HD domain-containing protein [Lachnospiraceae bacterium]|nr:HD domain-containing protein [Lachnospiraceae bacterium]
MRKWRKSRKIGVLIIVISLVILLAGLTALHLKVVHDLNTPFQYHLQARELTDDGTPSTQGTNDGSVGAEEDYVYSVEISKHWVNDPGVPLQTYGAQYDNTITNLSTYDIVNWSLLITVPERNITIDSYWNGEWEYDKKSDSIFFTPDNRIERILAGDSATFGAVMISRELMDFTDVVFVGCRYKPITKYFLFWVIMVLLVAWVTSVIAFAIYSVREDNYIRNEEKMDNVISQTMSTFANFIDTKDKYTKGHSARVSYYSQKIAEKLGMSKEEIRDIGYIGLMHDCGKLAIPEAILNKPGKLSGEEFEVMKTHTINGDTILKDFTAIDTIRDGALYHHERYDGTGYMKGLAGNDIPLVARIIGVADAMDAMNSDRCYRNHLSRDVILSELEKNKGTQFDPAIAQIMIDMINSGEVFIENDRRH